MAYRNPESLTELIREVINIALENKMNFIHATVDPKNPIGTILQQFTHTKMKLGFFTKLLTQETLPRLGEKKLYVDALEM
jgi:hypothetical protein